MVSAKVKERSGNDISLLSLSVGNHVDVTNKYLLFKRKFIVIKSFFFFNQNARTKEEVHFLIIHSTKRSDGESMRTKMCHRTGHFLNGNLDFFACCLTFGPAKNFLRTSRTIVSKMAAMFWFSFADAKKNGLFNSLCWNEMMR